MGGPNFDASTGWWYVYWKDESGVRRKQPIQRDPRWSRGGAWPAPGTRPRCPADVALQAAPYREREEAARRGRAAGAPAPQALIPFFDAYVASYTRARKPRSAEKVAQVVRDFLAHAEGAGVGDLEGVTRPFCRAYLDRLAALGRKHNTIGSAAALLSGAFRRAVEDGLVAANPWSLLAIPVPDHSEATPVYTEAETEALAAALAGRDRDLFLVGLWSGLRSVPLRNLEWRDVRWSVPRRQAGVLICRKELSKGGEEYHVPLFGPLREVLARRYAEAGSPGPEVKVFPGRKPGTATSKTNFVRALRKACARSGVPYRGSPYHSLRATFATLAHARGANPRSIQAWMNHASIQQTDRYSRYTSDTEDAEVAKVDAARLAREVEEARKKAEVKPPGPPAGP